MWRPPQNHSLCGLVDVDSLEQNANRFSHDADYIVQCQSGYCKAVLVAMENKLVESILIEVPSSSERRPIRERLRQHL